MITVAAILGIILLSGLLGGYAGYILGPPDPVELKPEKRNWYKRRSLILGVVAAFMVPLFLELVGAASGGEKNLVDHLSDPRAKLGGWLVFAGFCLASSVSAQRFISAMTKRLFDDLIKETKKIRHDINDLDEDLIKASDQQAMHTNKISGTAKKVLQHMYSSSERRPRREDLDRNGTWTSEELDKALNELEADGLVRSKHYDGVKRWRVRSAGKALLSMDRYLINRSDSS